MKQPDEAMIALAFFRELDALLMLPDGQRERYVNEKGGVAYVGGIYVALEGVVNQHGASQALLRQLPRLVVFTVVRDSDDGVLVAPPCATSDNLPYVAFGGPWFIPPMP